MPMIRPNALRSLQSSLRHSTVRATARSAPSRTQLVARRYASSGGHGGGHGEPSSDLPWMLGAIAITPPACWYLWPEPHAEHHGEHGAHGDHAEAEGSEEKQEEEAQSEEEEAPQETSAPAEQADKSEKGGKDEDKPEDKSGDESKGNDSDKSEKPADSEGSTDDDKDAKKEPQATSKEPGSSTGDISQKQKGLSTTDTKHSIPMEGRDDKSTKGSGEPETAKAKGTVDSAGPVTGGPGKN